MRIALFVFLPLLLSGGSCQFSAAIYQKNSSLATTTLGNILRHYNGVIIVAGSLETVDVGFPVNASVQLTYMAGELNSYNQVEVILNASDPSHALILGLGNGTEIKVNDYIQYYPDRLVLKAGETKSAIMIVELPTELLIGELLQNTELSLLGIYCQQRDVLVTSASAYPTAFAGIPPETQPYVAGYFNMEPLVSTKVYMRTTFCGSRQVELMEGFTMSILSTVGNEGPGIYPSKYVYQIGAILYPNGLVKVTPQIWGWESLPWIRTSVKTMDYSWIEIELVICAQGNGVPLFYYVAYKDDVSYIKDIFVKEVWYGETTNDTEFLVGRQYNNGNWYYFLQFGIESPTIVTTDWYVEQYYMSYYSSNNWRYNSAKTVQGSKAYVTYNPVEKRWIGGQDYHKAYVHKVWEPDVIVWKWGQFTQETIWEGAGTVPGPRH